MSEEAPEGSPLLEEIESCFDPSEVRHVLQKCIAEAAQKLRDNLSAIEHVMPYLTNLYYTDSQWGVAEREMFRLEQERRELMEEYLEKRTLVYETWRSVATSHT